MYCIDIQQVGTLRELQAHPKLGASWEGFGLLHTRDAYFWATHGGAELDLLVTLGGKRYGFEFKYQDAPARTLSMLIAREDLGLERLWVVYPGSKEYALDAATDVVPLTSIPRLADELRLVASGPEG